MTDKLYVSLHEEPLDENLSVRDLIRLLNEEREGLRASHNAPLVKCKDMAGVDPDGNIVMWADVPEADLPADKRSIVEEYKNSVKAHQEALAEYTKNAPRRTVTSEK